MISEWLAEIELAAGMEEWNCSGFIVDKHQIEFETLDAKIAKGIMMAPYGHAQTGPEHDAEDSRFTPSAVHKRGL